MAEIKNEHIVYAYAELADGSGHLLVIGLTDKGIEYLNTGEGTDRRTLVVTPPGDKFRNVVQVVVFHEKDKATLKQRFREAGVIVSEVH